MDVALEELKRVFAQPPMISKPDPGETLFLYLVESKNAVSVVLVQKKDLTDHLVYYVNKSLQDVETRYSALEKLVLALVTTSRKLKHYFKAHPIKVLTNFPIKVVLAKLKLSERMVIWAVKLGGYGITHKCEPL